MAELKRRISGINFCISPLGNGKFQILGISQEVGAQDELLLVSEVMDYDGLKEYAKDFRMLADVIDKITGEKD
jgi:hypothetical protein